MSPRDRPAPTRLNDDVRPTPLGRTVLLHLGPGVLAVAFFVVAAPLLARAGWPPVWGVLLSALLVVVPVELALLRHLGGAGWAFRGYRRSLPWPRLAGVASLTFLAAALLPGLALPLEPVVRNVLFGWLPHWFAADPGDLASYSPGVRRATAALWIAGAVIVGPVVEEAYFRGYLLPRLAHFGWAAPVLNAALFALYHLWQPHAILTVFLTALPLAFAARWTQSWVPGAVAHVLVNAVAFGALWSGVVQR